MKNGKLIVSLIGLFFIATAILFAQENNMQNKNGSSGGQEFPAKAAERIEVFVFHSTSRCISCITVGKWTEETINKNFQTEISEGRIEFREINIDLPENKEIVRKFKATGSSLFINAIRDGKDNIEENTKVWRLLQDEAAFKAHVKVKLDNLLGK